MWSWDSTRVIGTSLLARLIRQTPIGIDATSESSEISRQGCIIGCVHTIAIYWLLSYPQYKLVVAFIIMRYKTMNASLPTLNNCPYVFSLQWFYCVWKKLDDIITHYCCIYCTDGTILTCMYQLYHILTNTTKINLLNTIKVFNESSCIGKVDDISVVVDNQHSPICTLYNSLAAGLFSMWYTRWPGLVQKGVAYHKYIEYLAYCTCVIYHFES